MSILMLVMDYGRPIRLPGYARHAPAMNIEQYVGAVLKGELFDPVLSIHMKDGRSQVKTFEV
jgi:hypothetical protein